MDEHVRRRDLVSGLLGAEHAQQYRTSPTFHAMIDSLAAMLPAMVDGLAVDADKSDVALAALTEAAKRLQFRPEVPAS